MMKDRTLLRRFGAMTMAFMLTLSLMATPALAADTGSNWTRDEFIDEYKAELMTSKTLTIRNAVVGATYDIYPVLTVKDIQENAGMLLFRYEVPDAGNSEVMKAIMAGLAAGEFGYASADAVSIIDEGKTYAVKAGIVAKDSYVGFQVSVDGDMDVQMAYSRWTADSYGKAFALRFADALKARIDGAVKDGVTIGEGEDARLVKYERDAANKVTRKAESTTVTFSDIPVGYYIVTSSAGKNVMSFTLPGEKDEWEINEKNKAPSLAKEVYDAGTGEYGSMSDDNVGDTVYFRAFVEAGYGVDYLSFKDTLSDGLAFKELIDIRFFPRTSEGHLPYVDLVDNEWKAEISDGSVKVELEEDADGNMTYGTETVRDVYEDAKSDANTFVKNGFYSMITKDGAAKVTLDGEGHSSKLLTASVASVETGEGENKESNDVLTVTFIPQWLGSKRVEGAWDASSDNVEDYKAEPIGPDDFVGNGRLVGVEGADTVNNGAVYNAYVGDIANPKDDGGYILICYSATLTDDAVVGGDGNENSAYLEYGHDPDSETGHIPTTPETTHTYTYEMDVLKHAMGDESTVLPGAEFTLRRASMDVFDSKTDLKWAKVRYDAAKGEVTAAKADVENQAAYKAVWFSPVKDGDTVVSYTVLNAADEETAKKLDENATSTLISDAKGRIVVKGLDADLYSLEETKAPNGYILADDWIYMVIGGVISGSAAVGESSNIVTPCTYTVSSKGTDTSDYVFKRSPDRVTSSFNTAEVDQVRIANASGLRMPDTGGIGTTVFYVGGAVLVLAAGALIIVRKRTGSNED